MTVLTKNGINLEIKLMNDLLYNIMEIILFTSKKILKLYLLIDVCYFQKILFV